MNDKLLVQHPAINFCDGLLQTDDGQQLKVHRILLSIISPFFRSAFCSRGENHEPNNICPVKGVRTEILRQIIDYSMTNQINITHQNVKDLLLTADYFGISQIVSDCCDFLHSNIEIENCVEYYEVSRKVGKLDVSKDCQTLIEINFEKLLKEKKETLLEFDSDSLVNLLQSNRLNVSDEKNILEIVYLWICKDPERRIDRIENLLQCIRMSKAEYSFAIAILEDTAIKKGMTKFKSRLSNRTREGRRPPEASKMFIVVERNPDKCIVRLTYDNTLDFWRLWFKTPFTPTGMVIDRGVLYVFKGLNCWSIRPDQDHLQPLPDLRLFREDYGVAAVNGFLYVVGGTIRSPTLTKTNAIERFDPMNFQWSVVVSMIYGCSGPVAVLWGKIYAIVQNENTEDTSLQCYDTELNMSMGNFGRNSYLEKVFSITVLKDKIYLLGLEIDDDRMSVMAYHPVNRAWKTFKELPYYKFLQPKGYVFNNSFIVYEGVEVANPIALVWEKLNKDPTESSHPVLANLRKFEILAIEDRATLDTLRNRTTFEWTSRDPPPMTLMTNEL